MGLDGHNGWDLWAPDGWPVRAAHDGTVTYAGEDGAGGMTVVIRTNEKFLYLNGESYFKSIYCHMRKDGILVTPGQTVAVGDIIAMADNTGYSTGSHLHFGLKPVVAGEEDWQWFNKEQSNGYNGAIDPRPYWTGYCAEDAPSVKETMETVSALGKLLQNFPSLTNYIGRVLTWLMSKLPPRR